MKPYIPFVFTDSNGLRCKSRDGMLMTLGHSVITTTIMGLDAWDSTNLPVEEIKTKYLSSTKQYFVIYVNFDAEQSGDGLTQETAYNSFDDFWPPKDTPEGDWINCLINNTYSKDDEWCVGLLIQCSGVAKGDIFIERTYHWTEDSFNQRCRLAIRGLEVSKDSSVTLFGCSLIDSKINSSFTWDNPFRANQLCNCTLNLSYEKGRRGGYVNCDHAVDCTFAIQEDDLRTSEGEQESRSFRIGVAGRCNFDFTTRSGGLPLTGEVWDLSTVNSVVYGTEIMKTEKYTLAIDGEQKNAKYYRYRYLASAGFMSILNSKIDVEFKQETRNFPARGKNDVFGNNIEIKIEFSVNKSFKSDINVKQNVYLQPTNGLRYNRWNDTDPVDGGGGHLSMEFEPRLYELVDSHVKLHRVAHASTGGQSTAKRMSTRWTCPTESTSTEYCYYFEGIPPKRITLSPTSSCTIPIEHEYCDCGNRTYRRSPVLKKFVFMGKTISETIPTVQGQYIEEVCGESTPWGFKFLKWVIGDVPYPEYKIVDITDEIIKGRVVNSTIEIL